jgi:hypothetical protein
MKRVRLQNLNTYSRKESPTYPAWKEVFYEESQATELEYPLKEGESHVACLKRSPV